MKFNLDSTAKLNIEIRPIKANEHQQLIDLWLECGLTRSWNNPKKDIQRKLSFQPDLLLGAFQKDQLVGSIMAGYDGSSRVDELPRSFTKLSTLRNR